MAFVLIILGAILFVTAVQGTTGQFASLLGKDVFSGYIYWAASILLIGGLGYIKVLRPLSNAFLVLLVLVLFVSNRGFFAKINEALNQIKNQAASAPQTSGLTDTSAYQSFVSSLAHEPTHG